MVGKKTYLDIFTYVIMSSALRQLFLMRFSFIVVLSLDLVPYRFVCYHIAHRHTSTAGLSRYRVRIVWNLCDWLTANVCVCVCSYRQLQLLLWSLSEFYIGTDITFLCVLSSAQWGSSTMPTQQCEWRRRKKLCEKYNGDIYGEWWWFGWMDEGRGPLQHTTMIVLYVCVHALQCSLVLHKTYGIIYTEFKEANEQWQNFIVYHIFAVASLFSVAYSSIKYTIWIQPDVTGR